jgi:carbonic anhydrase
MFVCFGLLLAAEGCAKVKAAVCADMVPAPSTAAAAGKGAGGAGGAPGSSEAAASGAAGAATLTSEAHSEGPQEQFALPFAWEKSPNEPLSRTRAYLREMARDNGAYMRRGPAFFKPIAAAETPRVTVVSCADSRVQSDAWDASPENDAYTVRNLGNQIEPSMGAIQYGVDALNTPTLMILGHTGCTAVRTAITGTSKLSAPIRRELATLTIKRTKPKKLDDKFFAQAVVDNVNDQVERALTTFAARVNAGQLTIIGAVYDFRNDLGNGPGKLSIVNVNGVTEAARLKAFHEAVLAGADLSDPARAKMDPFERLSQVFAEHIRTEELGGGGDDDDDDEPETPRKPAASKPPSGQPPLIIPPSSATGPKPTPPPAHQPESRVHGAAEVPAGAIPASAAKPHH